jgi:hypothetical protein
VLEEATTLHPADIVRAAHELLEVAPAAPGGFAWIPSRYYRL